jgi:excisionase family DNA binding protein
MTHPVLNEVLQKLEHLIGVVDAIKKGSQPYLCLKDAAKYLCISKSTLYKHTSDGHISFYKPNGKVILFSKDDLEKFITSKRISSNSELKETVNQTKK